MIQLAFDFNQRWNARRDSYRPAGETIRVDEYAVVELLDDTTPRRFVTEHHYSGTYPAARFRFGLYHFGELVGIAVFSHPCSNRVLTNAFPMLEAREAVELGRFVLLDRVPGNGETWFLARCFEQLRGRVRGVVSFSDPMARTLEDGTEVFAGHLGTIYQAHNAVYLGTTVRRTLKLLPNGRVFSARAVSKIRRRERGWRYAVEQLLDHGAPCFDDGADWHKRALEAVTRTVRHPGNHRYVWGLDRRVRRALTPLADYPKSLAA